MIQPLSYHLRKVPFHLYVTHTYGANWNARKTRNKLERRYSWLRAVYGFHCSDRALDDKVWLDSEELGEMNDRYHAHMLLGSLPKRPTKTDCFAMQWLWKETFRGGFSKIRPYSPSLAGVEYVLKSLSLADLRAVSSETGKIRVQALAGVTVGSHAVSYAGANAYELGKIGKQYEQGLEVTLSLGLQRLLQSGANSRRGTARSVSFFRRGREERSRGKDKG